MKERRKEDSFFLSFLSIMISKMTRQKIKLIHSHDKIKDFLGLSNKEINVAEKFVNDKFKKGTLHSLIIQDAWNSNLSDEQVISIILLTGALMEDIRREKELEDSFKQFLDLLRK